MANRRQTRRQRKQSGGIRVSPEFEIGVWGVPLIPIPFPYLKGDIKVGTSGGGKRRTRNNRKNRSNRSNRK